VLKKSLTESALLEMYDKRVNQEFRLYRCVFRRLTGGPPPEVVEQKSKQVPLQKREKTYDD
jgi:hypothetical protein